MRKLLLILLLAMPVLAWAEDNEVHDPTSDITVQWDASVGLLHYVLLSDASDATFDSVSDNDMNGFLDMFQFDDTAISDSTIDSVVITARYMESNAANTWAILDSIPGVAVRQTADPGGTGSYADYSINYTTKPGGGAYTWTDIDNMMAGFIAISIVNKQEEYVSEIYFTVYYQEVAVAGASQVIMIGGD